MGIEICLMKLWEIVFDVIAIFRLDTHVLNAMDGRGRQTFGGTRQTIH